MLLFSSGVNFCNVVSCFLPGGSQNRLDGRIVYLLFITDLDVTHSHAVSNEQALGVGNVCTEKEAEVHPVALWGNIDKAVEGQWRCGVANDSMIDHSLGTRHLRPCDGMQFLANAVELGWKCREIGFN